jgi:hypothetical protein
MIKSDATTLEIIDRDIQLLRRLILELELKRARLKNEYRPASSSKVSRSKSRTMQKVV